jgi:ABC-type branched-subunit amino acid transport system ATPase component
MTPTTASDDIVLDVREVSVSYGGVKAVDEVSFEAKRGQIVGFIGPNGAGKTTVFDAICGFVTTQSGRVILDGKDITGNTPTERARKGLGRSFQDARLFSSLTVFETLACAFERHARNEDPVSSMLWAPWVRKREKARATRVEEIIDLMGLGAFHDKFISELSTGSRRVVDLACVMAHEPTVLLLDEPSSGMAQKETEAMGPLLLRVKEATGCTMLLVEHDMPLVTSVSDELVALETGRVIVRGTPKEVTNNPRVIEAYLGTDERVVARSGAIRANGKPKRKPPVRTTTAAKRGTATAAKAKRTNAKKKAPARKRKAASSRAKPKTSG